MKRYLCEGIVKGAAHQRNGLPCQDSKKIVEISEDVVIIAVADGHGSEKCPRSDRGAMIAVNVFCEVIKNYLQSYEQDRSLITFLNREGDMRFAQDICEEWQARVKQSYYKNKAEGVLDEDGNIKWPAVYSLYGTTLLGVLITETFVFSFQIGDGDINVVTENNVSALVEPEKFLGTETHLNILVSGNLDSGILETDIPEEGNSLIGLFTTYQVVRYCQAQSRFAVL